MKLSSYNTFIRSLMSEGLTAACEKTAQFGFDGVELIDLFSQRRAATYEKYTVDEYRRAFDTNGLCLACYSSAVCLYTEDEEALLGELFRQADFVAALGGKLFHHTFTIGLPHGPDTLPYRDVLARVVPVAERLAAYCDKKGLTCLYEPQGFYMNGIDGLGELFEEMKRRAPNVGICGDTGNPLFVDVRPDALFSHFSQDIKHVHVKDYISADAPLPDVVSKYQSREGKYLYDCDLGEGVVDIEACLKSLHQVGYDGYISFEILGEGQTVSQAIQYVKDKISHLEA